MRAAQEAARDAERPFPVRVTIAVPPEGFGSRLDQIIAFGQERQPARQFTEKIAVGKQGSGLVIYM